MAADAVIVRRAEQADARAVGDLTCSVYVGEGYADPNTAPGYVAELSDGQRRISEAIVFVAESDGEIFGTVTAAPDGSPMRHVAGAEELEIRMLAVRPADRRRGVAARLVSACEQLAAQRGCSAVALCTDPAMSAARRLYERRGYVRTPERDWVADGVALLSYRLQLPIGASAAGVPRLTS